MRKWRIALLTAALLGISHSARAQGVDELRSEVERLRSQLGAIQERQGALEVANRNLAAQNAELQGKIEANLGSPDGLESRIRALSSDLDAYAGTTVESVANPIKVTGEARVRAGWTNDRDFGSNGAGTVVPDAGDDDGTFIDARFNLGFDFSFDRNVSTHFEMIANGLFDNGQTDPRGSRLSDVQLYQGWILFSEMFGHKELGARTGRQEIVLGNEFQFGNNDFFAGETFDSTLVWWNDENWRLIFVWAKMAINDSYDPANHPYVAGNGFDDDEAYALYFTLKSIKNHELDLYYFFWNGHNGAAQGTFGHTLGVGVEMYAHVFGARLGGKFPDVAAGLDYNVEVAYETGDLDGLAVDVDGLTAEGTLGITFDAESKFRLYFMALYAEGFDGNQSGYVPLFPERHAQTNWADHTARMARWGIMDIMPMANVIAFQLGATFRPDPDWILGLTAIYGWHDEDVTTIDATTDDGIGFEIDLFAEHRVSDTTTLGFGLGIFVPDEGAPLGNGTIGTNFVGNDDSIAVLLYMQARVAF